MLESQSRKFGVNEDFCLYLTNKSIVMLALNFFHTTVMRNSVSSCVPRVPSLTLLSQQVSHHLSSINTSVFILRCSWFTRILWVDSEFMSHHHDTVREQDSWFPTLGPRRMISNLWEVFLCKLNTPLYALNSFLHKLYYY